MKHQPALSVGTSTVTQPATDQKYSLLFPVHNAILSCVGSHSMAKEKHGCKRYVVSQGHLRMYENT